MGVDKTLFQKPRNGLDGRARRRMRFGGVRGGRGVVGDGGDGGEGGGGDRFSWLKIELVLLMEKELSLLETEGERRWRRDGVGLVVVV